MRIIRELRLLISLEFLLGLSLVTVKWKSFILRTPRHSIYVQFLFVVFNLVCLYVFVTSKFVSMFTNAEELFLVLRRSLVIFSSIVISIESLLKRKAQNDFWRNLNVIECVLRKEFQVSVRFKLFLRICLFVVASIFTTMIGLLIFYQITNHRKRSLIFMIVFFHALCLFFLRSFFNIAYAVLILVNVKGLNYVMENKVNELFLNQIKEKILIFRQLHYHLFCAIQSFSSSSNYSMIFWLVLDFVNILNAVYFTILSICMENNQYYINFAQPTLVTATFSLLNTFSKLIVSREITKEVWII